MESCKSFARKYPLVIAALTIAFVFSMLKLTNLFPETPLDLGISEIFAAVMVFGWAFLFLGKEKVTFRKEGFGYTFRIFRGYLIGMTILGIVMLAIAFSGGRVSEKLPINVLNALLLGAGVGIVEEFSYRGLVFGGILQKVGNSRKGILTAAVVSGLFFGVMHVAESVVTGEVTDMGALACAVLKTVQTGIFGVVIALVYYKTRNLYAVAAIHGLNDLIPLLGAAPTSSSGVADSYVSTGGQTVGQLIMYVIFTVIMIPVLVKCIRDLQEKEAIPFDDDFLPRAVAYKK